MSADSPAAAAAEPPRRSPADLIRATPRKPEVRYLRSALDISRQFWPPKATKSGCPAQRRTSTETPTRCHHLERPAEVDRGGHLLQ